MYRDVMNGEESESPAFGHSYEKQSGHIVEQSLGPSTLVTVCEDETDTLDVHTCNSRWSQVHGLIMGLGFVGMAMLVLAWHGVTGADSMIEISNSSKIQSVSEQIKTASQSSVSEPVGATLTYETYSCHYQGQNLTMPRDKPGFIIIGTPKASTLALRDFFAKLPLFMPSRSNEPHYFDTKIGHGPDDLTEEDACEARYRYMDEFRNGEQVVHFEKTPGYLAKPVVAKRIYDVMGPNIKLIATLRDPVERSYSAYKMYHRLGHFGHHPVPKSFDAMITQEIDYLRQIGFTNAPPLDEFDPETMSELHFAINLTFHEREELLTRRDNMASDEAGPCLRTGLYSIHLERYLKLFPSVYVVTHEELYANHTRVMGELVDFLGYPEQKQYMYENLFLGQVKDTSVPSSVEPLSNRTRQYLRHFFRPYNDELAEVLGKEWRQRWGY